MKNKLLLTLFCALMGIMSAMAAEGYAVYTANDSTLTFYYGTRPSGAYPLNYNNDEPRWYKDGTCMKVARVVFDSSFSNAKPHSTYGWFEMMRNLTSITNMEYLNAMNVTTMESMFYGCSKLTSIDLSHFNTSMVTNMKYMFSGCSSLESLDLSTFNTENVVSMVCMFSFCKKLTVLDLGTFNTAKVLGMSEMFRFCENLSTIFVSDQWGTASVQNSDEMFYDCTKLKGGAGTAYDASHVDASYAHIDGGTSNPGYFTDKNDMKAAVVYVASSKTLTFYYDGMAHSGDVGPLPSNNTTQPWWSQDSNISANVQKVVFDPSFSRYHPTSGFYWFANMTNLTSIVGIENLNTYQMVNMCSMFCNCSKLTSLDLSNFNTSKVTNMGSMFKDCSGLTSLNVTSFNTTNVKFMSEMFSGCSNLTSLDMTKFSTVNATSMLGMFRNCSKLTALDLSSFNTAKVTDMTAMFSGCFALTTIYAGDGWSTAAVTESNSMFRNCVNLVGGKGTTYNANHIDKAYARIDGGTSNPGYLSLQIKPYAMWNASQKWLTFYFDNLYDDRNNPIYFLNEGENLPGWIISDVFSNVKYVFFDPSFADARPTSTCRWFFNMEHLYSITGLENLNTSEVAIMKEMFDGCSMLTTLDLSHFNTAKVYDMSYMFNNCSQLVTIVVGDQWNIDRVSNSQYMFAGCNSILGCKGTVYDQAHITKSYAHIDKGPSDPGYLSDAKPRGFKYDGIWYDNSNGSEVSIIPPQHYDHYTGEVIIPSKITFKGSNYTPHLVEAGAFTGSDVTSVDLPGSVVVIESGAFTDASKLKKLVIGWNYSPDYIQIGQDFAGGNANGFACYVKNSFLTKYEETYVNINFAPWVQISETYYTELKPYRPFSCKYKTKLPAGLEAYYVKSYDSSTRTATATKVNGVLPANTGFLLKGNECKIYLLEKTGDNAITITGNMLMPRLLTDQPWNQSDNNAYFFFNVGEMNWGSTVNISQGESFLCIPKSQLGSDSTSPINLGFEESALKGDVNGDGKVNVSDVSTLINMILGITPTDKTRADVNGDGKVNVSDVTALINIILGIN